MSCRDDLRRKRGLNEARRSGLIPAEKDEEGRDINPHIPQYIAQAPWYLHNEGPSLKHQRRREADGLQPSGVSSWYTRGIIKESAAGRKRFPRGACANCGATSHVQRDCTERPRARGAKYTGVDLAPDEHIPTEKISDFEAKRDRWGGFDPDTYRQVVEEYEAVKSVSRTDSASPDRPSRDVEPETLAFGPIEELCEDEKSTDGAERIKDFDVANAPVGTKDDRTRTTTRNLRIREDTAKYLINLDIDSAFYDPKTRSMRGDPTRGLGQEAKQKILFRGDNAIRNTGESIIAREIESFAWSNSSVSGGTQRQANPTELELMFGEAQTKKGEQMSAQLRELADKYKCSALIGRPED